MVVRIMRYMWDPCIIKYLHSRRIKLW